MLLSQPYYFLSVSSSIRGPDDFSSLPANRRFTLLLFVHSLRWLRTVSEMSGHDADSLRAFSDLRLEDPRQLAGRRVEHRRELRRRRVRARPAICARSTSMRRQIRQGDDVRLFQPLIVQIAELDLQTCRIPQRKFLTTFAAAETSFCPVTTAIWPAKAPFNSATPASLAARRKMEFLTT